MTPLTVPAVLAETIAAAGPEGEQWLARLPVLVEDSCRQSELLLDGPAFAASTALVLPVRRLAGDSAVLKVVWPHPGARPAIAALRTWDGQGAVRLLDHDPDGTLLLLERLDADRALHSMSDVEGACDLAASLLPVLHRVDPPEAVPLLADLARDWEEWLLPRWETAHAPFPRRRAEEARELAAVLPTEGEVRLLHGDLHLANVLAGPEERGGWLAIDPKPLAGEPAAEALALLRSRSEVWAAASDTHAAIRGRLARVCDTGELDPDRARAWALLRSVVAQTSEVLAGRPAEAKVLDTLGAALATSRAF